MNFQHFKNDCQYLMGTLNWCERENDHVCIEKKCRLYVSFLRHKLQNYEKALLGIFDHSSKDLCLPLKKIAYKILNHFKIL